MDQKGIGTGAVVGIVVGVVAIVVVGVIGVYLFSTQGGPSENVGGTSQTYTNTIFSVTSSTTTHPTGGWPMLRVTIDGKTDNKTYLAVQSPTGEWADYFEYVEGGQPIGASVTHVFYLYPDGNITHGVIDSFNGTKVIDVFPPDYQVSPYSPPENGTYKAIIRTIDETIIYQTSLNVTWS